MTGRVVVLASVNVDTTVYVDDFATPGETIAARDLAVTLGGKGTNQAVAARRAGGEVDLAARVGADANGELAIQTLGRLGLGLDGVDRVADAATGIALITVARSGENTVIVAGGANHTWTADSIEALRPRVARADLALTQGEVPPGAVDAFAVLAASAGTRFALNLAPVVEVADATLALADPLIVNEHEARAIGIGRAVPRDAGRDAWLAAAGEAVTAGRARSVVVTLGSAGAVAASHDGELATVAAPRVEAVDTTGAGDGFTGTLVAFLAEGYALAAAVRLAVAAASLAVLGRGTVGSYAPRERVLAAAAALEEQA